MELNVDSAVAMPQHKRKGMILVADGREVSPPPPHIVSQLCRDKNTLELTNYIMHYILAV
jgi:hypothetical protein